MKFKVIQNKNLFLKISPDMGASIINFLEKNKNINIFRPLGNNNKINKYNSYFTGYFATVPYFGNIRKKSFYDYNKGEYISLPKNHILEPETIHGEGWINKWKVNKLTKNSIELSFYHDAKKGFPCIYNATQKFKLTKNSLIISISIENLDQYPFDCGIGFHPLFNIDKNSKIYSNSFNYLQENKSNNFKITKYSNKKFLDLNKNKIDKTFLNWNGKSKLIINKNISLNIINNKKINNLHVYSPPKENFFCIEPVTNTADAYYLKKIDVKNHGLICLKPNKKIKAECEFEVIIYATWYFFIASLFNSIPKPGFVGGNIFPSLKSNPSVANSFLSTSTHNCGGKYSINAQLGVLKAK